MIHKATSLSGSQNWSIRYSADGTNTATVKYLKVFAIRLDGFNNFYYQADTGESSTTGTTYVDKTTLTQTPAAADHLELVSWLERGNDTSNGIRGKFVKAGSDVITNTRGTRDSNCADGYPFFWIRKATLAASSTTWKTQFSHDNAGSIAYMRESRIGVLELGEYTPPPATFMVPDWIMHTEAF